MRPCSIGGLAESRALCGSVLAVGSTTRELHTHRIKELGALMQAPCKRSPWLLRMRCSFLLPDVSALELFNTDFYFTSTLARA